MIARAKRCTRERIVRALHAERPQPLGAVAWIVVFAVSVVLFWFAVPALVGFYDVPLPTAFVIATVQCTALPTAVRLPRTAVVIQIAAIVVVGLVTRGEMADEVWPLPPPNLLALIALLVIVGLREEWFVSVAAWWLSFLAMTAVVFVSVPDIGSPALWGVDVLVAVSATLVALVVAIFIGQRRRVRAMIAEARRDVELEQARRETVEERARIARELHDVVAHSMSIVHIQAESARYRVHALEDARAEFTDIARSARSALTEMRQLLGALRPEGGDPVYSPQPTIADIPLLIAGAERVGSPVTFTNSADPASVSPLVQLTAYRIVQEALSNVIRHAPLAAVVVSLRSTADSLHIAVRNDPPPGGTKPPRIDDTGGHGLSGMRERVVLLHGDIEQTPLPDGGYFIGARLPLTL